MQVIKRVHNFGREQLLQGWKTAELNDSQNPLVKHQLVAQWTAVFSGPCAQQKSLSVLSYGEPIVVTSLELQEPHSSALGTLRLAINS